MSRDEKCTCVLRMGCTAVNSCTRSTPDRKGVLEAKYTYRVNALHTEPNTPQRMCSCCVWCSAQVYIERPVQPKCKGVYIVMIVFGGLYKQRVG